MRGKNLRGLVMGEEWEIRWKLLKAKLKRWKERSVNIENRRLGIKKRQWV